MELLLEPDRWHVIGSWISKSAKHDPQYLKWSEGHTHAHEEQEVLFVLSGRGIRRYFGQIYPFGPGTIFLADTQEPHDCGYRQGDKPGLHLVMTFRGNRCMTRMLRTGSNKKYLGYETISSYVFAMESLGLASAQALFPKKHTDAPRRAVRQRCANALRLLVAGIVEMACFQNTLEHGSELQFQIVTDTIEYIQMMRGKNCTLDMLARRAGYSKFYFSRMFEKYADAPLKQYVNQTRIEAFYDMQRDGQPLKNIAKALGFSHQSALSRWILPNICGFIVKPR